MTLTQDRGGALAAEHWPDSDASSTLLRMSQILEYLLCAPHGSPRRKRFVMGDVLVRSWRLGSQLTARVRYFFFFASVPLPPSKAH
jgi:hypothetical protein